MTDNAAKSVLLGKEQAEREGEPFYWSGATDTRPCGCVWHELLKTDGSADPIWMGPFDSEICDAHRQHMVERVHQLIAEGKLPADLLTKSREL